jgi:multidrug efflux pump subunit AcrA (membrane-fusion protein)
VSTTIRLPRRRDPANGAARPEHQPPRRRPKRLIYGTGVLIAAVIVFFSLNAVYGFTTGSASPAASSLRATVERGNVLSSVSASGNVAVAQSSSANFATSGTITAVYASAGEHVKAGQALAKISPTSARNTLASAKANLAMAESTLVSAESGPTSAQSDANTISIQQAQQAVTTDEQQLSTDQSTLATAKAQLARDGKLGFPASSTSSGSASTGTGSASTGSGSSSTGSGSASTGTGSASSGSGSASSGSGSASTGSGSASTGSGSASTGSGSGSGGSTTTHNVISLANGSTSTAGTTSAAPAAPAGPTVVTGSASAVGPSSATLSGSVTPGGLDTTYYFVYGTSPTSLTSTTPTADAGSATGSVPVGVSVSGLAPGQNYYFELVATNSSGTTDGSLALFTTASATATATTGQASAIGSTTATLTGSVNPGGLDTTDYFQYGTSAVSLSSSTPTVNDGAGSGSVSVSVTLHNLKPDTTYEFRLAATNSSGTSDGVEEMFTTSTASKPTVVTASASGVLTSSVTLSGSVNPGGSDAKYRFDYGTSTAYGSKTALVDAGSGTTASQASATLTGLKPDTEYVFRLVASNKFGTSTGLSEFVTTASSSRAADEQAVTTDEQTVARQEATVETAKESVLETEASIASGDTPAAATIAGDKATVSEDEATVASDEDGLSETTLRAPIAGTVTAVTASVGAAASAGSSTTGASASSTTASSTSGASGSSALGSGSSGAGSSTGSSSSGSSLFTIDSLGQLEIVAGFAEADATQIAVGQPVTITFPALPDTEVAGRLAAVSLTSTVVSDVVTYDETIDLVNPPATVKEGMTANVSVVDQTATNVLYVPSAAITTTGTVSTVEVLQKGKTTSTRVTTGLVGNSDTQILSGLKVGEVLVEPTVTVVGSSGAAGTTAAGGGLGGLGGGGFAGGGRFGG